MKTLKFDHVRAQQILNNNLRTTFRLYDDKDLFVNDEVQLIDKVDPDHTDSWRPFGIVRIDKITEKRLSDLTAKDYSEHDGRYSSREEILKVLRQYYGPQINDDTPIKIIRFSFVPENGSSAGKVVTKSTDFTDLVLYSDGGSRGNPGPSASGYVLMDSNGTIVVKKGVYLGHGTNNRAEYMSLKFGLEKARELGAKRVHAYMDSQLVVKQMQGAYKIKNKGLIPIYLEIRGLVGQFEGVTFTHVPRELNKLADAEVNKALDAV